MNYFHVILLVALLLALGAAVFYVIWNMQGDNITPNIFKYKDHTTNYRTTKVDAKNNARYWTTRSHHSLNTVKADVTDIHNAGSGRRILFWNQLTKDALWGLPNKTTILTCPLASCTFTSAHNYLNHVTDYDAIVFYGAGAYTPPVHRKPYQMYVFAMLESAQNTDAALFASSPQFNLTMTYRLDSDIMWTHNHLLLRQSNQVVAPSNNVYWQKMNIDWLKKDKDLTKLIKTKNKFAAWFVSSSEIDAKSEKLVKALQKHIQIDIFGPSGNQSCSNTTTTACNDLIERDYKFYISFENTLCRDFVTENLYNALNMHIIPIVYGGSNYKHFAPPHSYIDVNSYDNMKDLVNYLLYLDQDIKAYTRYFWWKHYYKIADETNSLALPYCDLCHLLHAPEIKPSHNKYSDIKGYWYDNMCTEDGHIEFDSSK